MKVMKVLGLAAVFGLSLFVSNCAKKITKVQVMPQTKEEVPTLTTNPQLTAPNDSFALSEADSMLKKVLKPVYFDFNKSDILPDGIAELEKIGRIMMTRKEISLLLEGNCDERGSEEYNMGLGQHRSQSVKAWLVSYGIADKRLETTSYGKERPAFSNCQDEACHAKNRRVEFKVLAGSILSHGQVSR